MRDILRGDDPQIRATVDVIAAVDADVLLLLDIDHDAGHVALDAITAELARAGAPYPYRHAPPSNAGRPTGLDIDGDGRTYRARDAHGYGLFRGDGAMALLSRYPIGQVRDFTDLLWSELPGSAAADVLTEEASALVMLHSVGAWEVEIRTPTGPFHVLASHATPPVFDGPEDRNGFRNRDELLFWSRYLDGWAPEGVRFSAERFALMATLNIDPEKGEGRREGLNALLGHPDLQDPLPERPGGGADTADWAEPDPGDLRVDYILPARGIGVLGAGVLWPDDGQSALGLSADLIARASDHRMVWVDLDLSPPP